MKKINFNDELNQEFFLWSNTELGQKMIKKVFLRWKKKHETQKSSETSIKEYHADGGAFVEPPYYKFHDAYFSVTDKFGNLIHFEKNIGNVWSGVAEYEAIKWVIENIKERPIRIVSDCTVAMAWVKKGTNTEKHKLPSLNLEGIELRWQHANKADKWNADNHSPKRDKSFYYKI